MTNPIKDFSQDSLTSDRDLNPEPPEYEATADTNNSTEISFLRWLFSDYFNIDTT
jgi:hypothetical protein